jgi:6-phosphofructokinase 1
MYASLMGAYAVKALVAGKSNRVVAYKHGDVTDFDIDEALKMTKDLNPFHLEVARMMAR